MTRLRPITYILLLLVPALPQCATVSNTTLPTPEMRTVQAGTFVMGARDGETGAPDERPVRNVTLSAYEIGKFEVTNAEYVAVLNWAVRQRYITGRNGDVIFKDQRLKVIDEATDIQFVDGAYRVVDRDGLPMQAHPVTDLTWYGAAAYTNWLSAMHGLTPCYDTETWQLIQPVSDGYRLPTEAEWERAAGWSADRNVSRWLYGYRSDAINATRLNFDFNNPLENAGLRSSPKSTPVGFFNGKNEGTVDSPSPVGCYDMSGNVYEWCNDWFDNYPAGDVTDPVGPPIGMDILHRGPNRVMRGGGWGSNADSCRVSNRGFGLPHFSFRFFGFRIARSR